MSFGYGGGSKHDVIDFLNIDDEFVEVAIHSAQ